MALAVADEYRRWFDYEKDSHAKTVASLQAVPANLRSSAQFRTANELLAHIIAARWLWLFRMGVAAEPPQELVPRSVTLEELPERLTEMESAWGRYLQLLDEKELERRFEYQSFEGPWFRNTVRDILTQMFGHSLYHRGQIAFLLRSIGCEPAVTDFLFWVRESIPGQAEGSFRNTKKS